MQVGSTRTVAKFYSVTHSIRDALLAMGHDVELRAPRHEDPEAGYDLIIAGLSCIASMSGRWSHDVYSWIGRHAQDGMPLAVYMDDWHMKPLISTLGSVMADPGRILRKSEAFSRPTLDWIQEPQNQASVMNGVEAMKNGLWPPFLVHQFPWGDLKILTEQPGIRDAWAFDPSGFYPQYPYEEPDYRASAWTYPRLLLAYDAWLQAIEPRLTWPVYRFGNIRNGEKIVPEAEVQRIMAEASGTFFPANTRHVGSGIWRPRILQAAQTKTVVYADPGEHMSPLLSTDPAVVEGLSPVELEELARTQSRWILENTWSRQQVCNLMHKFLAHATGRDLGEAPTVEAAPPPPQPAKSNRPPLVNVQPAGPKRAGFGAVRSKRTTDLPDRVEGVDRVERPRREPKIKVPKPPRVPRVPGEPRPFKPAAEYAALELRPTDVVLDIGAHVGEFAAFALNQRVSRLASYEADPTNFAVLRTNVFESEAVQLLQAAVTVDGEGTEVDLWLCNGSDTSMHGLLPKRGRAAVQVPAVGWKDVLYVVRPTVVKVAVEGYEHNYDWAALEGVRAVGIKFHPSTEGSRVHARAVVKALEDQGFKEAVAPQLDKGSWPVVGIWRR